MSAFVLEIGTEELPARFLPSTEKELAERAAQALEAAGLEFSGLEACSTPRRLILFIAELGASALSREEVVTGPPLKAAFDVGGRPTRAAEGFAKTQGVELEDTFTVETEKGPYLAVRKQSGGERAENLLAAICPELIGALPFPKRMKWGSGEYTFARPIRWLLCLHGDKHIAFSVAGVESGRHSRGHRVYGPGPFTLENAADYFTLMKEQCRVIPKGAERRQRIIDGANALAESKNGTILWKESLLDEVQGLCELPVPVLGGFDPSFLEVPREVLLTSMESHQKSFGLQGKNGDLLPYFLTVLNMEPQDPELVRKGWERVLRARLEDARFFWKSDLSQASFDTWLTSLDSVIFLAALGCMGNKSRRIEKLCAWLFDNVRVQDDSGLTKAEAARAGRLCKADLVSEMVKEFDTLQGVMGGMYAGRFGESPNVASGIAEQYLPAGPDSPVPGTLCGALVSLADKADTLAGCFGLGMIPTGAADPYALRRACLGITRIAEEKGLSFSSSALFAQAMAGYGDMAWKVLPEQSLPRLQDFFTLRLKNHCISKGVETLLVEAAIQAGADDVQSFMPRLFALESFSRSEDFAQSVLTFKRAANIIRKQGQEEELTGKYQDILFADDAEKSLAAELERIAPLFDELWHAGRYQELFALLGALRPFVDAFFEQVMVMCEDTNLRRNRLNLLQALVERLGRLADFGALQM